MHRINQFPSTFTQVATPLDGVLKKSKKLMEKRARRTAEDAAFLEHLESQTVPRGKNGKEEDGK